MPYWGTINFLFFKKPNKNADFLRKMENRCAFWQNRKTALPQQHGAATHNFVLWGKAVFLFSPNRQIILYPRALRIFQKGKEKIKNGRGSLAPLRSARFLVHFSKIPVYSVRRNKKILRYCLDFSAVAGHGAAWKRLRKKQEAGPGAVRRRGLRF